MKAVGLAALFAAGIALVGVVATSGLAETTTETVTELTTTSEVTTAPATTVVTTATVQHTTTRRVIVTTSGTTTSSTSDSGSETPTWAWVVIGILALALIVLAVLLGLRGRGGISAEERRRRLDHAVGSWAAQGWALESQTADSAVLRRDGEAMLLGVDQAGNVSTRPLASR